VPGGPAFLAARASPASVLLMESAVNGSLIKSAGMATIQKAGRRCDACSFSSGATLPQAAVTPEPSPVPGAASPGSNVSLAYV
jgi:hypothetical protein